MAQSQAVTLSLPAVSIQGGHTSGKGPRVVLLHDLGDDSTYFSKLLEGNLGKQLRLYAFDLPGHGKSSTSTDIGLYTIPKLSKALAESFKSSGVGECIIVGVGFSGHLALHLAETYPAAKGVVLVDSIPGNLPKPEAAACSGYSTVFEANVEAVLKDHELVSHLTNTKVPVGAVFSTASVGKYLASMQDIDPCLLWRQSIQVLPGDVSDLIQTHSVCMAKIFREFCIAVFGNISPLQETAVVANQAAGIKGHIVHPQTRFEPASRANEGVVTVKHVDEAHQNNPYARGKLPGDGHLPHPSLRFENPGPKPEKQEPQKPDQSNPYARGRVKGGVMPHPSARFEGYDDQAEKSQERRRSITIDQNPHIRGRVQGGVMPHPSARFEAEVVNAAPADSVGNETHAANPYRRGRVPAGHMPHPGMRFENPAANRTSVRVAQPPGGKTNNVFG